MADNEPAVPKIRILRKTYDSLKDYPLFFFNAVEEYDYSLRATFNYWQPEAIYFNREIVNSIPKDSIDSSTGNILFAFGRLSNESLDCTDEVLLELEQFNSRYTEHIRALFLLFLNKAANTSDQYQFRELLWVLHNYFLDINVISEVLSTFDISSMQPFFWNALKNLSLSLSLTKQNVIQRFLQSKGIFMNIYCPQMLVEAVKTAFPQIDPARENISIFKLIELAIVRKEYRDLKSEYDSLQNNISNFFLQLRRWLVDEEYILTDIPKLATFIRLTSPDIQFQIVQRYFCAVWNNQTQFDIELIRKFQVNQFENWGIFYHCAFEPSLPVKVAVPLLCDNIITFFNSGQRALQTINGTLDLAYMKCDTNSPEVDFGLKKIVPVCHGGAVPNLAHFGGFVSFYVVFSLIQSRLSKENIISAAKSVFNQFGRQHRKYNCFNQPENSSSICNPICYSCENRQVELLDKWDITLGDEHDDYKRKILRLFCDKDFPQNTAVVVFLAEICTDTSIFKSRIVDWLNNVCSAQSATTTKADSGETITLPNGWVFNNDAHYTVTQLAYQFVSPSWFKVSPSKDAYIGRGVLDAVTGLTPEYRMAHHILNDDAPEVKSRENSIITPRIISSLATMVKVSANEDGSFIVPYNEQLLREIKSNFYTPQYTITSSSNQKRPFLTAVNTRYERYCAPKFDNDINLVTQLPYFWCRNKECFRTSLSDQTMKSCKSWKNYTILHVLEILGYPQVTETSGGNEASELIRSFIGMVNKAESLFKRVRCRECNHILFPIGSSNFNRYNNFECRVPTCSQHYVRVYLSQCHHCKSGLIDSRDSAKCPNGWHICPKCLSCCDDAQYERQANKYVLRHLSIPPRVVEKLGHGHNDKGQYFCPKCGGEIITVRDEHIDRTARKCVECNSLFENIREY